MKQLISRLSCWWSKQFFDIHKAEDDVRGIPDHFGEYRCQRCNKIFKL
jgi:hypothetical protein